MDFVVVLDAEPMCGSEQPEQRRNRPVETIKVGYNRYIITSAAATNNVTVTRIPGITLVGASGDCALTSPA